MTDPPRAGSLPPGYDDEDPYEGEDLSTYPDWWRQNIELFEEYELRPYRPPRFTDGAYTPAVIEDLKADLGVEIRLRARNPEYGGQWEVAVGERTIGSIDRRRDGDGFTVYDLSSEAFRRMVRDAVSD
jgi:hypothetical protein